MADPRKLATYTTAQLRSSCPQVMRPLARAVKVSVEEVNSSAPVSTTRASPVAKTTPPTTFAMPHGSPAAPTWLVTKKTKPTAM